MKYNLGSLWQFIRTKKSSSSALWYGGSSIICQLLRLVAYFMAMRFLEGTAFADWARFQLLIRLSMIISEIGQNEALYASKTDKQDVAGFHLLMCLVGCILSIPIAYGLVQYFDWNDQKIGTLWWLAPIACFIKILLGTAKIHSEKAFQFKYIAFVNVGSLIAHLAVLVLLREKIDDYRLLVYAFYAEFGISMILLFKWIPWHSLKNCITTRAKSYYFKEYLPYLAPKILAQKLANNLDFYILDQYGTDQQLGLYERGAFISKVPMSASINLVDKPVQALSSKKQDDPKKMRQLLLLLLIGIPLLAFMALCGLFAFLHLFGDRLIGAEKIAEFKPIFPYLIAPALIQPVASAMNIVMTGSGKPKMLFWFTVINMIAKAGLALFIIKSIGITAGWMLTIVAFGWLIPTILAGVLLIKDYQPQNRQSE